MKFARIIFYALVVIAVTVAVISISRGQIDNGANIGLWVSYALFGIGLASILVASIVNLFHHPESGVRVLVGLVLFGIIAGLGYYLSPGEVTEVYMSKGVETANGSKVIDAEMALMYGLGILAIISILAAEIKAIIKNT